MSTMSTQTSRTDNEDALWRALNAAPMATTAELSAAAGITSSSARKILGRWAEDNTVTRHADDANSPHRWAVTDTDTTPAPDTAAAGTGGASEPAAPATDADAAAPGTDADAAAPGTDTAPQDTDTRPAEPAADAVSPADAPAASEPAPAPADDSAPDDDTDPDEMPDDEEESPFGAPCPIAVGDEVANRYHRSWRGRVTEMAWQHGIARCVIETPDGAQSSIPPWVLVPAGLDGVPEEWQQQMDALVAAQRDRAADELQDRSIAAREHLEDMTRRLNGIAAVLDSGTVSHDDATPIADSVGELEDAMLELQEFRTLVIDSGLLTVDEIKRATARPAPARVTSTRATAPAANHSPADKLPPGGLRGMVEDALRDNPGRTFTSTALKRVMDAEHQRNISSGAISNALDKLTEQGVARRISDAPRTWALIENA
ncbi:hypothetical protein [Nocardia macrotermitis]|uniref:Uncharacterized protein n=1 Tax=Nocardia macrotermitis TaxID=2585198 RepID=A0A7K0DBG3_9NOCA|nr:hypothetical protein [Nocardia macrotermitis]MQY23018.1 hypothetical protein [Nocardia macrotermitis]